MKYFKIKKFNLIIFNYKDKKINWKLNSLDYKISKKKLIK